MCCVVFFFVKQKTAYEMRISDWSSDVCSSDLADRGAGVRLSGLCDRAGGAGGDHIVAASRKYRPAARRDRAACRCWQGARVTHAERLARLRLIRTPPVGPVSWHQLMQRFGSGEAALDALPDRSEERRVGKEWGRTWRTRWAA